MWLYCSSQKMCSLTEQRMIQKLFVQHFRIFPFTNVLFFQFISPKFYPKVVITFSRPSPPSKLFVCFYCRCFIDCLFLFFFPDCFSIKVSDKLNTAFISIDKNTIKYQMLHVEGLRYTYYIYAGNQGSRKKALRLLRGGGG